jgi:hypothetical protein
MDFFQALGIEELAEWLNSLLPSTCPCGNPATCVTIISRDPDGTFTFSLMHPGEGRVAAEVLTEDEQSNIRASGRCQACADRRRAQAQWAKYVSDFGGDSPGM